MIEGIVIMKSNSNELALQMQNQYLQEQVKSLQQVTQQALHSKKIWIERYKETLAENEQLKAELGQAVTRYKALYEGLKNQICARCIGVNQEDERCTTCIDARNFLPLQCDTCVNKAQLEYYKRESGRLKERLAEVEVEKERDYLIGQIAAERDAWKAKAHKYKMIIANVEKQCDYKFDIERYKERGYDGKTNN